eukprot:IDg20803t1
MASGQSFEAQMRLSRIQSQDNDMLRHETVFWPEWQLSVRPMR